MGVEPGEESFWEGEWAFRRKALAALAEGVFSVRGYGG